MCGRPGLARDESGTVSTFLRNDRLVVLEGVLGDVVCPKEGFSPPFLKENYNTASHHEVYDWGRQWSRNVFFKY